MRIYHNGLCPAGVTRFNDIFTSFYAHQWYDVTNDVTRASLTVEDWLLIKALHIERVGDVDRRLNCPLITGVVVFDRKTIQLLSPNVLFLSSWKKRHLGSPVHLETTLHQCTYIDVALSRWVCGAQVLGVWSPPSCLSPLMWKTNSDTQQNMQWRAAQRASFSFSWPPSSKHKTINMWWLFVCFSQVIVARIYICVWTGRVWRSWWRRDAENWKRSRRRWKRWRRREPRWCSGEERNRKGRSSSGDWSHLHLWLNFWWWWWTKPVVINSGEIHCYGRHVIGQTIILSSCGFFFLLFSSPNLSGRRLDVYHTSTHSVALV